MSVMVYFALPPFDSLRQNSLDRRPWATASWRTLLTLSTLMQSFRQLSGCPERRLPEPLL